MTDLRIHRFTATVPAGPDRRARVDRMLGGLARQRLSDALRAAVLPDGHWCVRRVDAVLSVDLERPDGAVETAWAKSLVETLDRALRSGDGSVVHYPRTGSALTDLTASVASGRLERAWAWHQLGLLPGGPASLRSTPADAVLAALATHPGQALPAVAGAVGTVGAPAVHRLLGTAGLIRLAATVCEGLGADTQLVNATPPARRSGPSDPAGPVAAAPTAPHRTADAHRSAAALARTLVARSRLADDLRRGHLPGTLAAPSPSTTDVSPAAATLAAWAVLVAAQADPASLRRPDAPAVLAQVAAIVGGAATAGVRPSWSGGVRRDRGDTTGAAPAGAAAPPADPSGRSGHDRPVERPRVERAPDGVTAAVATPRGGMDPTAPEPPATAPARWPTPWAGLLFLLNTAAAAALPADLLDDPALAGRPLWWSLHRLALLLSPAADDDPAALALAGLLPGEVRVTRGAPAPRAAELTRLATHARRWRRVTAARLSADSTEPGPDALVRLTLRAGEVVAEPGWLEIHLGLDQVDLDVRRAGLDTDPGWVPWLGWVVRFGYA